MLSNESVKVIDVSTPEEFSVGHVTGSQNIPLNELPQRVEELSKHAGPVFLCASTGKQSLQAEVFLRDRGLTNFYEGGTWAASLYSDDHGRTWQFGTLVGPGMDENKTVELSDGTILLNSRAPGGFRKVARSTDGGITYTGLRQETALVDPTNNASIVRFDLDAPTGSPAARQLLFSNTEHPSRRRNLTVKMSCDDGETWPVRRTVEAGPSAYSTLTPLGGGRFGLLYEAADESGRVVAIRFVVLDRAWLGAGCKGT